MTEVKENKMGYMPVGKLLFSMAVPMMISMLVQALYNVVDSIFVARISENALTAVSLAFPIQNLMIAVASGTGVGVNALVSRSLGERKADYANTAANNSFFLYLMSFLAFALIAGLFGGIYYSFMAADPEIISGGTKYIRIVGILSFGLFYEILCERLLQSTGKTIYSMISQMSGAITNIILDPLLIFGMFGLPKMGIAGAALATVLGQVVGACLSLMFNLRKNKELTINPFAYPLSGRIIKEIYAVGVPSIMMVSIGSVMNFCINKILMAFSSTAVAVFGVYFKLQSFIFMPVFGLNNGMVPIVAYNYGARNPERIKKTIRLAAIAAISIMAVGFLAFQFLPRVLLGAFNATDHMLEIGIPAFRIISWSFMMAGFCIVSSSVFQAMGHGVYSLLTSVVRQLVVLVPAAFLLSRLFGLEMVWWSFPIAELAALALSVFFLRKIIREEIDPLEKAA